MTGKGEPSWDVLLRLRRRREAVAGHALTRARGAVDASRAAGAELAEARAGHEAAAGAALLSGRPCPGISRACLADLTRAFAGQSRRLAKANAQWERARCELIDAIRERKALACLQERTAQLRRAAEARRRADDADDLHAAHRAFGAAAS